MTRPLLKFFSLTYAATWICWTASGVISRGSAPAAPALAALAGALFLLGTFAPALVALALTERAEGRAATRALLRRVFEWRVSARWYVFAVGYIPAVKLSVAAAWLYWRTEGSLLLVMLLPGKGMALLPSPSPKNRACDFRRTRLKHFKRPLRRTRYNNRSFLRNQFARAIAYDKSDASQPDWPLNHHRRLPPRHGDASASRFRA